MLTTNATDPASARVADERAAGRDGESVLFFVGRENYPVRWVDNPVYTWGKAQVIQEGSDVVLIGSGVLFNKALEAAKILASKGKSATVINNPFVNLVDVATIGAAVQKCGGRVVTIEDHQVIGRMGGPTYTRTTDRFDMPRPTVAEALARRP